MIQEKSEANKVLIERFENGWMVTIKTDGFSEKRLFEETSDDFADKLAVFKVLLEYVEHNIGPYKRDSYLDNELTEDDLSAEEPAKIVSVFNATAQEVPVGNVSVQTSGEGQTFGSIMIDDAGMLVSTSTSSKDE